MKKDRKQTKTRSVRKLGRFSQNSSNFYNSKLYKELYINYEKKEENNSFPIELENKIILGSSEMMKEIPNNSVHLTITSPPYNVSKEYDDDLSLDEYLNFLMTVFSECFRVLVYGGRLCVNLANIGRKPYLPISDYLSTKLIKMGFLMRGEILWNKSLSVGSSTAWGSWKSSSNPILRDIHEYILVFSKGCFKRELSIEERESKKNTIKKEDFMEWTKSIWSFSTESAKRINHPAPFPIDLPYRLIQLYSFTNDIILDPFMGSGTTGIAALKSERKFVGYDISKEYITIANNRIDPYRNIIKFL